MVVEGILIAAYAVGANQAWVYIRGEYDEPYRMLTEAIEEARAKGYIGPQPMGKDYPLDIRLYRGHGAYICGEETALLESLEGKRAQPRSRPPFPAVMGAWGDRKSTRLNSSHLVISYAVFCLKKKKNTTHHGFDPNSSTLRTKSPRPHTL